MVVSASTVRPVKTPDAIQPGGTGAANYWALVPAGGAEAGCAPAPSPGAG